MIGNRLYWLRGHNFGDVLNPVLFKLMIGQDPEYSDSSPKILAIGSLLHEAKPGDVVWGTGALSSDLPLQLDRFTTQILAVRGPMTARLLVSRGIDVGDIPMGDPSLLLPRFLPMRGSDNGQIGFLPHYYDYGQVQQRSLPGHVLLLDPATEPIVLIQQIVNCRAVVSSSLHGICVAEAYGVPALWVELSDGVLGAGFKFMDYYASTKRFVQPKDWGSGYHWEQVEDLKPVRLNINLERLLSVCPFGLRHKEAVMAKKADLSKGRKRKSDAEKVVIVPPKKRRQSDQAKQTGR